MRQSEDETKNLSCKKCGHTKGFLQLLLTLCGIPDCNHIKSLKENMRDRRNKHHVEYILKVWGSNSVNCNWEAAFLWANKKQVLHQRPSPLPLNLKEWKEKCLKRHFLWSDNVQVSFYWRASAESSKVSPFRRTTHILNASSNDIV